jgi:hypothetical protein
LERIQLDIFLKIIFNIRIRLKSENGAIIPNGTSEQCIKPGIYANVDDKSGCPLDVGGKNFWQWRFVPRVSAYRGCHLIFVILTKHSKLSGAMRPRHIDGNDVITRCPHKIFSPHLLSQQRAEGFLPGTHRRDPVLAGCVGASSAPMVRRLHHRPAWLRGQEFFAGESLAVCRAASAETPNGYSPRKAESPE